MPKNIVRAAVVVALAATGLAAVGAGSAAAADTTPPTQPGAIVASGLTATGVHLAWGRSSDNVAIEGYRVYRSPAGQPSAPLNLISTTDNLVSYTATHLFSGKAYTFGIVAIDPSNNKSVIRTVTLTTPASGDTIAPSAPASSSVSLKAFSSSRVDLVWAGSTSTDVAAYQVLRNNVVVVTADLPAANRYSDNGLAASTSYGYSVRAIDSAGNVSGVTTPKSIMTPALGTLKIARGPLLSSVTGTSAVISWWTNLPTPGVLTWGTTTATGHTVTDPAVVQHHVLTVPGLPAGAAVMYQVGNGAGLASAAATFHTAAAAGVAFSLAAIGDYGGNSPGEAQNAANIRASGAQLIQTTGDNIYASRGLPDPNFPVSYSDVDQRFYKIFGANVASQPFFPANGNQEYYGDGFFWNNFPMPGGSHSWYSYTWGNAHILVMDGEQPFTVGTPQYLFAQADLAAHQGDKWRIVVFHHPPYSSTSANSSSLAARAALVPLWQAQHVKLVLSGNSHNYERTKELVGGAPVAGGITYIVNGAGGNGFNKFTIPAPVSTAFREDAFYEYLKVNVSATSLVVQAIRADTKAVVDTATIT
jgi:Iron/zinc purple acid phosphatase-like protein C/Calcineurin-like phosphoesterase